MFASPNLLPLAYLGSLRLFVNFAETTETKGLAMLKVAWQVIAYSRVSLGLGLAFILGKKNRRMNAEVNAQ